MRRNLQEWETTTLITKFRVFSLELTLRIQERPNIKISNLFLFKKRFLEKERGAQNPAQNGLRESHLNFGNYAPDYSTTYNREHHDKGVLPKDSKSIEIMKDLRKNHYELGYHGLKFNTTHQDEFIDRGCNPSKLNPQLAKDLRSHHSRLGNDGIDWGTTYRSEHQWKQPDRESYE